MTGTMIRLPISDYEALKVRARQEDRSAQAVMRRAIREYLGLTEAKAETKT